MDAFLSDYYPPMVSMGFLAAYFIGSLLTECYPEVIAVVFLAVYFSTKIPAKGLFLLRALVALVIAVALAHVNRWFYLYPPHLLFPSGHMTFCLGVSISLGMLRPWTLAITLPLLIPFGIGLVAMHFHTTLDVLGAFPLVALVYGVIHRYWRLSPEPPPLDMAADSP
jgi:hypothetical protein